MDSKTVALVVSAVVLAAAASMASENGTVLSGGAWTKGGYDISGSWEILEEAGGRFLVLDRDFGTKKAPDLKIFLSPTALDSLGDRNATDGSVLLAPLERHRGAQRYAIDDGIDLVRFKSIIIHCERYSKYWGGADLHSSG